MKTIGTCENCQFWNQADNEPFGTCETFENGFKMSTYQNFGCLAWKNRRHANLPNYPSKTPAELRIEDLERENDAAFKRIEQLSRAMVALGYDPTQLGNRTAQSDIKIRRTKNEKGLTIRAYNSLMNYYGWGEYDRLEVNDLKSRVKILIESGFILMKIRNIGVTTAKEICDWCGAEWPEWLRK